MAFSRLALVSLRARALCPTRSHLPYPLAPSRFSPDASASNFTARIYSHAECRLGQDKFAQSRSHLFSQTPHPRPHLFTPIPPLLRSMQFLSSLPPPDATNPVATTTFSAQSATQNSLTIVQEIIQILEKYEDTTFAQEVESCRKRLGAPSPDVTRQEAGYEIWGESHVCVLSVRRSIPPDFPTVASRIL